MTDADDPSTVQEGTGGREKGQETANAPRDPQAATGPADGRQGLRERIAEALMHWAAGNNDPTWARIRMPETVTKNAYARADAVLAALDAAGYCPHCGRGDCAPTADAYEAMRQRAVAAEAAEARWRQGHETAEAQLVHERRELAETQEAVESERAYALVWREQAERLEAAHGRVRKYLDGLCGEPHPGHDHVCPDDVRTGIRIALDGSQP